MDWDINYAKYIRQHLRITLLQIHRCYEILKLSSIIGPNQLESELKKFRIMVKKRLYLKYKEELLLITAVNNRKAKLHQKYIELESYYLHVIKKAKRKIFK